MKQLSSTARKLLEIAPAWMVEASAIAMHHYEKVGKSGEVMVKDDDSPLTRADLEVDDLIVRLLSQHFGNVPVVTEERAASHAQSLSRGKFFLVDPIDGTKEFIGKRGEFTINIGLIEDGQPTAGIVCAPALGVCYTGALGEGAWESGIGAEDRRPISVAVPDNAALRVVASRSHLTEETKSFIAANPVSECKNAGSSLKFCLLAKGEADLYPRFGPTMEWDTAAGDAVLRAAGGFVSAMDGSPMAYGRESCRNGWFIAGARGVEFTTPDDLAG